MDKNEDLKYQLETLASYEQDDLDGPEFDVGYEVDGIEGFATICIVELAEKAAARIKELECQLTTTKREHFAGLAMQAMLSSEYYGEFCAESENNDKQQAIAELSISQADALLKELDKVNSNDKGE